MLFKQRYSVPFHYAPYPKGKVNYNNNKDAETGINGFCVLSV